MPSSPKGWRAPTTSDRRRAGLKPVVARDGLTSAVRVATTSWQIPAAPCGHDALAYGWRCPRGSRICRTYQSVNAAAPPSACE